MHHENDQGRCKPNIYPNMRIENNEKKDFNILFSYYYFQYLYFGITDITILYEI